MHSEGPALRPQGPGAGRLGRDQTPGTTVQSLLIVSHCVEEQQKEEKGR
jgi:hypothetical protein